MDLDSVAVLKSLKTTWNSLLQLTNIAKTAYWTLPKDRLRWLLLTSQSPGNAIFHLVVGLQLNSIHTSVTHTSEHQHLVKNLLLSFSLDSMKQRHTYACSYHKYIWGLLQGSDTWWDEMMKLFSGKWHDQFNLFPFCPQFEDMFVAAWSRNHRKFLCTTGIWSVVIITTALKVWI